MSRSQELQAVMHIVAFYNLKGGVGKTTSAVNVAWEAADAGLPTLLWDLDPQAASSWYLQHDEGLRKSAKKLISGRSPVGQEICRTPFERLDLLPGDQGLRHLDRLIDESEEGKDVLAELIRPLGADYRLVVLDCPPNFSKLADAIFRAADLVVVPLVPSPLSMRAWEQLERYFKERKLARERLAPFLSMVDRRRVLHRQWVDGENGKLRGQLEGWIPYLSQVEQMGMQRAPVAHFAPRSAAAAAYRLLWRSLNRRLERLPVRHCV